ncbi:nicotinate-nucleotide adenylyltransferase [Paenibacillus thermotolerans]|uniref:nicotinate-nucleotide adenylyltransferase n=1 Tax=Paenibacillus thermotolerans TaxID=3027807 RepID=UPI0023679315|nr:MULTISPECIES: nicotinate-nucleotide adenylyltransferase [unclassified Paenibacillus]
MTRRIGILGGTFNPVHTGHLILAERVREHGRFDEIWFIPAYQPPHKPPLQGADPAQRAAMVEAAIRDNPGFRMQTIEIDRGGVSYTIDTVLELKRLYPDDTLVWIIGADMVKYLNYWHRIDEIVQHIEFLGVARPGYVVEPGDIPPAAAGRLTFAELPEIDISSSEIRGRVRDRLSVRYLVPEPVHAFITENKLYEA